MASDDLRARIAEVMRGHFPVAACIDGTVVCCCGATVQADRKRLAIREHRADAVMAVVRPELDRRDKRIEEYRESRRRWMEAAYADRRASESVGEQLRAALAALQAVREAQSLGEALAAVAKHDGLTRDLVAQPTADPQPVSPEFFAELKKATARESDDLHDWYAAMDDQPTTKK